MAVLQMQRVSICALKKDRKAILEKLQALGVMEMNQIADEEGFEKMDTVNAKLSFEKKAQLTETALGILDIYAPQLINTANKTNMFFCNPRRIKIKSRLTDNTLYSALIKHKTITN